MKFGILNFLHIAILIALSLLSATNSYAEILKMQKLDKPSSSIFNKNRRGHKEVVVYKNQLWACAEYRQNDTCVDVREATSEEAEEHLSLPTNKKRSKIASASDLEKPPTPRVFDKKNNRWAPEKILWNKEYWKCSKYNDEEICEGVIKIKESQEVFTEHNAIKSNNEIKPAENEPPCACIFTTKNKLWAPEKIDWNDEEWKCSNYDDEGVCEGVEKIK